MKRYRGQGLGGVVTLILAIVIFPVVWFTLANEAEMLYREDGQEPPITHDLGTLVPAPDHRFVRVVPAHAARAERVLGDARRGAVAESPQVTTCAGNPPVAIGPQRCGVTRISDLP